MSNTAASAKAQAQKARDELASALDAIEDKLNVPKRVNALSKRAQSSYEKNPTPWIVGAASAAVGVVGLIAWALHSDD
jgi:ElaB/YqjD/DUF883 family membrane-anchored ribosome-binding protein